MLPVDHYHNARHHARYHIQVCVLGVTPPATTPGFAGVRSVVERVFRTDDVLRVGDPVTFTVGVTRRGDRLPCGGIIWMDAASLKEGAIMEAFLDGTPPACSVALSQCTRIACVTAVPTMRGRFPVTSLRFRWWRRWARWSTP